MLNCTIPQTNLKISRIAYGIGMLGVNWRTVDFLSKTTRAIRTALEAGITFFDTADIYAEGRSEAALGRLLGDSPRLRDTLVIQSKCGLRVRPGWVPGDAISADSLGIDLSHDHIVKAAEESLERLRTDRLDVLLLHAPSPLVQPEEVAQAFDDLKDAGKVLHFGVCMHTAVQIELLKKYARQPLVANQIWLSLAHPHPITEESGFGALLDYCRLHQIQVQAFSPLKGEDIFTTPQLLNSPPDSDSRTGQLFQALQEFARKHRAPPAAIMLAWLLRHPIGIVPIIGASTPEHIEEDCIADRVTLSREEWEQLLHFARPC